MSTKTDVAVKTETPVSAAQAGLPAHLQQLDPALAGLGNSTDSQDVTLPFLTILQKGSPQVNKQEPEYIRGAEVGMVLNTATGQLYSGEEGFLFIPVGFQKNYVEWIKRTDGGGYIDTHPFDLELIRKMGAFKGERGIELPNGHQLVETSYTFGLLPGLEPAVIGAASSALKPMRDWMSLRNRWRVGTTVAPAFSRSYMMQTIYQKNEKGDWYNWKIKDGDWLDAETFEIAKKFALQVAAGEVKMGRPGDELGAGEPASDDGVPL